ncbi:formamidopyrimidine-DNA glycosylase [Paenibacillus melissococcoides]|uniref:Formamidopyrimidine-DNA glycosylase n=1 Tax=Paenibacillus melissococcoides TaxID=2912268 RepID=A0ABM9G4Y1_9BACL|nr:MULTISPECIES: DNA-formamidopyrimidine glycosylase family protein [Paenibacillus]MEB9894419.1 DNA-formamidopyrimidine glycosylase family protein [Bacillus cereus]CAH8246817.1 formamidopyrimidine-DNA glycosylase [Paenibacillus melissococcoides]CAH8715845.1 formamidopyrimidine-DNA glycosylase [Paenibacillus melissococcoides]CAH8716800.1 formamidopyrimidine-DNA glycosylase [Paenibacillus melissococcoides]GIO80478.1 formamidopyrimidine-DNA glycosylase [Paenibacillus dendritiformis]
MPGIPEIEGYRKRLDQDTVGQRIRRLDMQRPAGLNVEMERIHDLALGRQILFVERRGTDLIFHLDNGQRLVLRLGQEDELHIDRLEAGSEEDEPQAAASASKSAFSLRVDSMTVTVHKSRSLQLLLLSAKELDQQQREQGPDPLSRHLTAERFRQRFAKRRSTLKAALMNPALLAGIDSRYADNIAFAAGLRPSVRVDQLKEGELDRLYLSMIHVLQEAIERQDRSEAAADGSGASLEWGIAGKTGEPCPRCGTPIEEMLIQRKPAYYCPQCQPLPPADES